MVSGLLCRHRKSPRHLRTVATNEEEQILLEIFNNARRARSAQVQLVRNVGQRNWPAQSRKFSYDKAADQMVIVRHEFQTPADKPRSRTQLLFPIPLRNAADRISSANQYCVSHGSSWFSLCIRSHCKQPSRRNRLAIALSIFRDFHVCPCPCGTHHAAMRAGRYNSRP